MGAPKPFPTRWPEPEERPDHNDPERERPEEPTPSEHFPDQDPGAWPEFRLRPQAVTWAITNPCNLRCFHCYDATTEKRRDLPTNKAMEVIEWLRDAGVRFIVFSGGEPLLRRDLLDLMAHCQHLEIGVGLRTNATLIKDDLPRQLKELGIGVVGTSLDGATNESHDIMRGVGMFQRTISGIKALVGTGIRVNVEVVLGKHNMREAPQFVELAEALGVAELNFSALTPQGRGVSLEHLFLDRATWSQLVMELRSLSMGAGIVVSPSCALVGNCVACVEPNVTCDGWVTPCYLSSQKLFSIFGTPPGEFALRLGRSRPVFQNVCGRGRWIVPHEPIKDHSRSANRPLTDAGAAALSKPFVPI